MHALTIAFGNPVVMWQLVFKSEEKALEAWKMASDVSPSFITLADDYGQTVRFAANAFIGAMLEDMDNSAQAHVDRAVRQHRMQAKAQQASEADPHIRAAMRGPAVLSPVPNFNGRN